MSTIRVDNFGPSAGGTSYSARGIAKAWVNFNGTGTIAARDSENVSSLTDNGAGDYTVNFSSAFDAGNYNMTGSSANGTSANLAANRILGVYADAGGVGNSAPTSTACRIASIYSTETKQDAVWINATFHGDLA